MEIIATQKFFRMSARKLRPVVSTIKKMKPSMAVEVLPNIGRRAGEPIMKVIKTAISNAKDKGLSPEELFFKEIQISEGPFLKRGQPVSRGRWHPIKKRMSHIRVVLTTKVEKKENKKDKSKLERETKKADLTAKSTEIKEKKAIKKAVKKEEAKK